MSIDTDTQRELKSEKNSSSEGKKGCLWGMGCFGCGILGCLGVIVAIILLFVGTTIWFKNNLLSETPLEIPRVYLAETEIKNLNKKLTDFRESIKSGESEEVSLQLTPKELNYLLQRNSKRGGAYISVDDKDNISFIATIPAGSTTQEGNTLYFNVKGKGRIAFEDEQPDIMLEKLSIGKLNITNKSFLRGFGEGFAEDFSKSEEYKSLPFVLKDLKVEKGIFYIRVKVKKEKVPSSSPSPEPSPTPQGND